MSTARLACVLQEMGSSMSKSDPVEAADESKAKRMARGAAKRLSDAGDHVGRSVRVQALKAEIMLKQQSIKSLKQELGTSIYVHLEKADSEAFMALFQETKAKVDAILAEIEAKRSEIVELQGKRSSLAESSIDEDAISVKMADGSPAN